MIRIGLSSSSFHQASTSTTRGSTGGTGGGVPQQQREWVFERILLIIVDSSTLFGRQRLFAQLTSREIRSGRGHRNRHHSPTEGRMDGRANAGRDDNHSKVSPPSTLQLLTSAVNSDLIPDSSSHRVLGSVV